MPNDETLKWRFVSFSETEVEKLPGKIHHWYCRPELIPPTNLLFVRAHLLPGEAHSFHYHPDREEILYILSGQAEQWAEQERRQMGPGDTFYVRPGIVHATFNTGSETLDFLAVIAPARVDGPITVEVGDQEPWRSLGS